MDDTLTMLPKYNWESVGLENISDAETLEELILTTCDVRPVSINVKQ